MPLSPVARYAEKHPNRVVIAICLLLFLNLAVGSIAYYRTNKNTEDLKNQATTFAHIQCLNSNKARRVIYDLLNLAEKRVKTINNPHETQKQKQQAIKFYEDAKSKIIFTKCPPPLP